MRLAPWVTLPWDSSLAWVHRGFSLPRVGPALPGGPCFQARGPQVPPPGCPVSLWYPSHVCTAVRGSLGQSGRPPRAFTDSPLTSGPGGPMCPWGPCQRKGGGRAGGHPVALVTPDCGSDGAPAPPRPTSPRTPEGRGCKAPARYGLGGAPVTAVYSVTTIQHSPLRGGREPGWGPLTLAAR